MMKVAIRIRLDRASSCRTRRCLGRREAGDIHTAARAAAQRDCRL